MSFASPRDQEKQYIKIKLNTTKKHNVNLSNQNEISRKIVDSILNSPSNFG